MSYNSLASITESGSLRRRLIACAAQEGIDNAVDWVAAQIWNIAGQPGWNEAWQYAVDTQTDEHNPDTGARPGVINDQMILAAVQAVRSEAAA